MNILGSIIAVEHPTEKDHEIIFHGINSYAAQHNMKGAGGYFFLAYDKYNKIIGAISGFDNFGFAEIGGLWIHEKHRNQGYGKALVHKAIDWAREKHCKGVTVFTLKEWPAFIWYKNLGFILEFERPGHANNSIGCYLKYEKI